MKEKKMNPQMRESIENAVSKTFEEMAFLDVLPVKELPEDFKVSHILMIDLLDPFRCCLALYFSLKSKIKLAENIYGDDFESLNTEEIDDCQLEILNVIAGNFIIDYFGDEKLKMDLPKILFDEDEILTKGKTIHSFYFDSEGSFFKLSLMINEE